MRPFPLHRGRRPPSSRHGPPPGAPPPEGPGSGSGIPRGGVGRQWCRARKARVRLCGAMERVLQTKSMTKPVTRVGVHEAKTQLSKLLRLVDAGQEVEILR